jgi:hypothetical protein
MLDNSPDQQQQDTDGEHLKLLSIFHYVVGGLAAFFACIPLIHLAMGLFMIIAPGKFGPTSNQPPAFLGWFLVLVASFFIVAGWTFALLVVFAGRFIARRKHHTFCFVMACVECIFIPFGTVLGAFTILVLMRPSVKEMFDPQLGL